MTEAPVLEQSVEVQFGHLVDSAESMSEDLNGLNDGTYEMKRGKDKYPLFIDDYDDAGDISQYKQVVHLRRFLGTERKLFGLYKKESWQSLAKIEHGDPEWIAHIRSDVTPEQREIIISGMEKFRLRTRNGYRLVEEREIEYNSKEYQRLPS